MDLTAWFYGYCASCWQWMELGLDPVEPGLNEVLVHLRLLDPGWSSSVDTQ